MAKSDKINSSSSLNHASSLSNDSPNTNKMTVDDVLRQLDSLSCPTPASFKHVTNIRDSKCDFSCSRCYFDEGSMHEYCCLSCSPYKYSEMLEKTA